MRVIKLGELIMKSIRDAKLIAATNLLSNHFGNRILGVFGIIEEVADNENYNYLFDIHIFPDEYYSSKTPSELHSEIPIIVSAIFESIKVIITIDMDEKQRNLICERIGFWKGTKIDEQLEVLHITHTHTQKVK
jgi:hypothetical protein